MHKNGALSIKYNLLMSKPFYGNKLYWDSTIDPVDYPEEIKKVFFEVFKKNRKNFTSWIGIISKKNLNVFETLIKLPTSRDPYKSNLFKNIIILLILKNTKIKNKLKFLKLENNFILEKNFNLKNFKNIKVIIKKKKRPYLKIIKSFLFNCIIFFYVKTYKKKKPNKHQLKLFNTFLISGNVIKDCVFPGLNNILNKKKINNFYFISNVLSTRNIFKLYKNLKIISKQNYIFKESFFSFSEFLKCFFYVLFYKFKNKKKYLKYKNLDCSHFIEDELKNKHDFNSEFLARLNYLFIKKLRKYNYEVVKSFGRFENQSVDKAWFYGMKEFYPQTKIYGFQGFLYYPHLMNQSPSSSEDELGLLPNNIIVTNKIAKINRLEFFNKAKITLGPSLGKQKIFNKFKFSYKYKFVVALCGIKSIDEKLITWIDYSLMRDKTLQIIIKSHPNFSINNLKNFNRSVFNRCNIINENIDNLLKKTQILISSGPSGVILSL